MAGFRHAETLNNGMSEVMKTAGPGFNLDFERKLRFSSQGSTIHPVSNMENVTDWDIENASNFNASDDATDERSGSNCIAFQDVTSTKGNFVTLNDGHRPDDEDWTEFYWMCFWVHDETGARTAGEYTFQIRNNGSWATALSLPLVSNVDMYELLCVDISDVDRAHVDGFRFVNQRGTGSSEKVFIDNIFVTDLITGNGDDTQVATGPVIGPVRVFPVETGQTIVPGTCVTWGAIGVKAGTAADVPIMGIACQNEPLISTVASDTALKEVLVACEGSVVWLRNDDTGMAIGEGAKLHTNELIVAKSAGSAASGGEQAFAYSLETSTTTAWAKGDTAYQLTTIPTEN